MQRFDIRAVWGVVLILAGLLFLAQSLGVIPSGWALLWAVLFAIGGAVFLVALVRDPEAWWAAIPGILLLGLSGLVAMSALAPAVAAVWGAPLFFGVACLSFAVVYVMRHEHWWALIPAGVALTLAVVSLLAVYGAALESGAALFLGLAATFAVVGIVPTPRGRMTWAFIPAGILGAIGALTAVAMGSFLNYIWPVMLILIGVYVLVRGFVFKRG